MTSNAEKRLELLKAGLRKKILEQRGYTDELLQAFENKGYLLCPNCGKHYKPMYEEKKNAPRGSIYWEQHVSGICSDECWTEFVGGDIDVRRT